MTNNPFISGNREQGHLEALECSARGDWLGTAEAYDRHLFKFPRDQAALMAGYFTSFYAGRKHLLRDLPARVVNSYDESERFYG